MVLDPLLPGVVGLALLHFCWQGTLIGGFLAGALALLRGRPAGVRYVLCLIGMTAMMAAPVVTVALILADLSRDPAGLWLRLPLFRTGASLAVDSAPVLVWVTWVWLAGASILQLRMITSWLWIRHLRRTASVTIPEGWRTELLALRARLHVSRAVRLAESRFVRVPCVVGWLRPVILVPLGVAAQLTSVQLRGILAHELAHIRRNDFLVNLVQCAFESLLFFHPMTWWISRRLRTEREYCCDDIALSVTDDAMSYARALVRLDEIRSFEPQPVLSSTGGNLMRRITRLFEKDDPARLSTRRWLPAVLATLSLVSLVVVASTGCLGDRDAPAEAMVGPAPAETAAPIDQAAMLALVTERIEACRASGQLTPEAADAVLAKLAEGDVVFQSGSCCGQEGMTATISCGPEDCAGAPGGACGPADCAGMEGTACSPADYAGVVGEDGSMCVIQVVTASGGTQ